MNGLDFIVRATGYTLLLFSGFLFVSVILWPLCLVAYLVRFYTRRVKQSWCMWRRRGEMVGLTKEQQKVARQWTLQGIKASEKPDWEKIKDIWNGKMIEEKYDDAD